ncbi:LPXTG cell wall anchor domain-containing protein [Actinomyces minihominis]|uniref:LPXTG cell wall anchor domain-containing protein n=1 Tax=Actinomyces minihominis TaxID=2002838 RepID=UPI000C07E85D|nr:SpaA isopeptide-forming pilin-related protein [Actinomyces minihominis]
MKNSRTGGVPLRRGFIAAIAALALTVTGSLAVAATQDGTSSKEGPVQAITLNTETLEGPQSSEALPESGSEVITDPVRVPEESAPTDSLAEAPADGGLADPAPDSSGSDPLIVDEPVVQSAGGEEVVTESTPNVGLLMAAPDPLPAEGGTYSGGTDNSDPATWTGSWSQQTPKQNQLWNFTTYPSGAKLIAKWERDGVSGSQAWAIEYTVAPERWGPDGSATPVPRPDRSQGGQVIYIVQNGNTLQAPIACNYDPITYTGPDANPGDYPGTCTTLSDFTFTLGTSSGPTPRPTVEVELSLSWLGGTDSCPPLLGSSGFIRTHNNGSGATGNIRNWANPVGITPESTCGKLTLDKVVGSQFAGTLAPSKTSWTLTATGLSGEALGASYSGAGGGVFTQVKPGQYALSEVGVVPGYTNGTTWSCSVPVTTVDGKPTITVASKADVTCSITNTDQPGSVTWSKATGADGTTLVGGSVWNLVGPGYAAPGVSVEDCVVAGCTGLDKDPTPGGFSLTGLAWGDYVLTETAAPEGFVMGSPAPSFQFTVNGGNLTPVINEGNPVVNQPLVGLTVNKQWTLNGENPISDADRAALSDAQRALYGTAALTLYPLPSGVTNPAWSSSYNFPNTSVVTVGETVVAPTNEKCVIESQMVTSVNGQALESPVDVSSAGFEYTMNPTGNTVVITNNVTCSQNLTLLKFVEAEEEGFMPADFTVMANGPTGSASISTAGSTSVSAANTIEVVAGEEYTLSEDADIAYLQRSLQKYTVSDTCPAVPTQADLDDDSCWVNVTDVAAAVTVADGQHDYYRFVNFKPIAPGLPITGGLGTDAFLIIGGVLLSGGLAYLVWSRRRGSSLPQLHS